MTVHWPELAGLAGFVSFWSALSNHPWRRWSRQPFQRPEEMRYEATVATHTNATISKFPIRRLRPSSRGTVAYRC